MINSSEDIFAKVMSYSSKRVQNDSKVKVKPSEKMLETLKARGFDLTQMEGVLKCKGNQLIVSCAGSGKTTSLTFKIIYDQLTGESTKLIEVNGNKIRVSDSIWVSTFLKTGADELERSVADWQSRLGVIATSKFMAFSTLHAEFKRCLNAMGVSTNIVSASTNSKYLKEVVKTYHLTNSDGRELNSENLKDLEGALTYTRNRLDAKKYSKDFYDELNVGPTIIDAILRDWKAKRLENGFVDFEDLQEMLYNQCCIKNNEEVINFVRNRYNYIYIDEFQDISQIQYELLKVYASGSKKIVAIGDDDQTIYSWRGSYNGIITKQFEEDFLPTVSQLSKNFRCPKNILNSVIPSIELNENRFEKTLEAYRDGGKIRVGAFNNYTLMVDTLGKLIYDDVVAGRSVAVLCRVNSDGLMPALVLDRLGKFNFGISGEGMTLNSYVGRLVRSIVKLFTERSTPDVKKALNLLTWDKYSVESLMKVCKNNKKSFWDISDDDLAYSCPDIYEILKTWKSWRQNMGDIKALQGVLQDYRVNVFKKDTQFNNVCKSVLRSISALLEHFEFESVEEFLDELDAIDERLQARIKPGYGVNVRIATVHEFKGKEADSVYIWNDSEDIFPHKNCNLSDIEEIEEERRVHYIACTRAKKISTILYLRNHEGMFFKELDLSDAEQLDLGNGLSGELEKKASESNAMKKFKEACYNEALDEKYSKRMPYSDGEENEYWGMDNLED